MKHLTIRHLLSLWASLLLFLPASAQDRVLWQIGTPDHQASEFAIAPDGYQKFVGRFGGEHATYYVGYSSPEKDWPYILPGPIDSWAGGGYWSGSYPRHFPRIFFKMKQLPAKGVSKLNLIFTDVNVASPPVLSVSFNGHIQKATLAAGSGEAINSPSRYSKGQNVTCRVPNEWLKKGINIIQIAAVEGSWAVFDAISFESSDPAKISLGNETLILSARPADFNRLSANKKIMPVLVDIYQLGQSTSLTFRVQGERSVTRTIEKGHCILEIPATVAADGKNRSLKFSISAGKKKLFENRITCAVEPLQTYADYVDLLMGTGNSRWMFKPGPSLPLSLVQIAPDNQDETWKAGYEYTVPNIMGFSHFSDWTMCGLLLMPTGGKLQVTPGKESEPDSGYRSRIDKQTESAKIGKYTVFMTDTRIKAEITATRRAALQCYTFPKMDSARIMVDLFTPSEYPYNLLSAKVTKVTASEIEGEATYYNAFTGYSLEQLYTLHFVLQFSKPFDSMGGWVDTAVMPVKGYIPNWKRTREFSSKPKILQDITSIKGKGALGVFLNYKTHAGEQILVRSGVSLVDIAGARHNLNSELAKPFGWDFEKVVSNARHIWNNYLGRVDIQTDDYLQKTKFYTNLYRAISAKAIWSDADGRYVDENEHIRELTNPDDCIISGEYWNTFWNNQQLFNLVAPEISSKWARSAITLYKNDGWFNTDPAGIEHTGVMVAMHVVSQIQGAWQSGIHDFELDTAYAGLKKMLTVPPRKFAGGGTVGVENLVPYQKYGYVPQGMGEVSNTMEYAYDDWCLSQMALRLGKKADYNYFKKRSNNWRNLLDTVSGFVRPKDSTGKWIRPFDPYHTPGFVEGNAFNYNWFVPQDPEALIRAVGKTRFINRLDSAMKKSSVANFNASGDDFASFPINHGNEPAMHVAYLFNRAGKPELTQKWVRAIQEQYYGTTPYDAYPGDEDLGQMSSWFVLSAIGLFQLDGGCSQQPVYEIGSPRYPRIVIKLNQQYKRGKEFIVEAHNASKNNKYIRSVRLNGKPITDFRILQSDVLKGGKLRLEMTDKL